MSSIRNLAFCRSLPSLLVFSCLLAAVPARSQTQCIVTCSPNPTSTTYTGGTFAARSALWNLRGERSLFSPPIHRIPLPIGIGRGGHPHAHASTGASTYDYAIPILNLPGRNGLDVNLTLFYSSRVWILDAANNRMTFNADRDFPSQGFRLSYGFIETSGTNILLTEPDGTKRQLLPVSGSTTMFTTVDSTYITWDNTAHILTRKNGERWTYSAPPTGPSTILAPVKIEDTNGNFISVTHQTTVGYDPQSINTITDTVGRVVTFNYNTIKELSSITVTTPGVTGAKTQATFGWTTIPLNFNYSIGVVDSPQNTNSVNVLSNCAYANSTGYTFTYGDWGLVDKISRVSANGTVRSYVRYDYPPVSAGALSDHPTYQHQFVSPDGTSGSEISWTYSVQKCVQSSCVPGSIVSSISVTDPPATTSTSQKTTTTNLFTSGVQTGLVSSTTVSTGSTTLRTVTNTWTQDSSSTTSAINPRVIASVTTLNDTSQNSEADLQYDTNGNVTQVQEKGYDGNVSRITQTDYLNTSAYTNLHILDRPTQVRVLDSGSSPIARTDLAYDGNSLTLVSGVSGHDNTNFSSSATIRGNLSSITRYTNAAAATGAITRQFTYDTLGNLLTAQVDCCQQEQWGFATDNQYAYPESLTRGPSGSQLVSHATYDLSTGLILTSTDENGQVTQFSYDNMNRLKTVIRPGSIQSTANYDDTSAQPVNSSTTPIDGSRSIQQLTTSDGLGRVIKQQLEDVSGTVYSIVDTQYDALGRVSQVSNPHGSSETAVFTQKSYDALSRVLTIIPPDGTSTSNNTQFSYSGNAVTVTDPAGKQRKSFTDAAGRLIEVDEPGAPFPGTQATGTLTISGSLNSVTSGGTPATSGQGSFTISGAEDPPMFIPPPGCNAKSCSRTVYNHGEVKVTINGVLFAASYGQASTDLSVANSLAGSIAASASPNPQFTTNVTSDTSGVHVKVTAKATGSATNYPLTVPAPTFDSADGFTASSFTATASGSNFTGGANAVGGTTTFDSGTLSVSVAGFTASGIPYGQSSNANSSQVATAVSNALKGSGSPVTVNSVSGASISLTFNTVGTTGNVGITVTPTSSNSSQFASGSFSSSGSLSGGANPVAPNLSNPYITSYAYDQLDDLTTVTQGADIATPQKRTFAYDSLGRVSSSVTPEAGSVSFTYTDFGAVATRTDARSVVATYQYDGLHRLTGVGYTPQPLPSGVAPMPNVCTPSGGTTANVCFAYGTSSSSNNNGRLTQMTDPTGNEAYTYDVYGRVTKLQKTIGSTAYSLLYAYNFADELTQVTYPSGRAVAQTVDPIGRLNQIQSGGVNFLTINTTDYNAASEPTKITLGSGVVGTMGYNARLQLASLAYASGSSTLMNLTYNYTSTAVPGNDGQIQSITDNVDNGRSESFTYDAWGRLATAQTAGSANFAAWGLSWTYDRYGNRLAQNVTAGSAFPNSVSVDATTNRINSAGYAYDLAGNMTNDGLNTMVYDGENHVASSTQASVTTNYTYDGNGLRIQKATGSNSTVYLFSGAKVVAEYDNGAAVASPSREYIYAGGRLLSTIDSTGTKYHLSGHLSPHITTDASGAVIGTQAHYPFGEKWYETGTTTKYKFTSYERDPETGNDYAITRYHINRLGRFGSVDRHAGNIFNPQSLNRYAYVLNNPVNLVDPLGLEGECSDDEKSCTPAAGGSDAGGSAGSGDSGAGFSGGDSGGGGSADPGGVPAPPDPGNAQNCTVDGQAGICTTSTSGLSPGGPADQTVVVTADAPPDAPFFDQPSFSQSSDLGISVSRPARPPITKDCRKALKVAGQTTQALDNAAANWTALQTAADYQGVSVSILAAVAVRESGAQNITGDFGHGQGMFQIDDGTYGQVPWAYNVQQSAVFAAGLLSLNYQYYQNRGLGPLGTLTGALRDYNHSRRGNSAVYAADSTGIPEFADRGTARGNYVTNVLRIARDCF